MALLQVISTGSSANCYILTADNGDKLIIECGVAWDEIQHALNYDLSRVKCVICSHSHGDHVKRGTIEKLHLLGIPVVGTSDCHERWPWMVAAPCKVAQVLDGSFTITPLLVPHGDTECYSYVVDLPNDGGRLLFATDCSDFPYTIHGVNFMLVEANYDEDILRRALVEDGDVRNASETHMEIDTTLDVIKRHISHELLDVVLIHLSSSFADERAFVEAVEAMNVACVAARKGMEMTLELYPF